MNSGYAKVHGTHYLGTYIAYTKVVFFVLSYMYVCMYVCSMVDEFPTNNNNRDLKTRGEGLSKNILALSLEKKEKMSVTFLCPNLAFKSPISTHTYTYASVSYLYLPNSI